MSILALTDVDVCVCVRVYIYIYTHNIKMSISKTKHRVSSHKTAVVTYFRKMVSLCI